MTTIVVLEDYNSEGNIAYFIWRMKDDKKDECIACKFNKEEAISEAQKIADRLKRITAPVEILRIEL